MSEQVLPDLGVSVSSNDLELLRSELGAEAGPANQLPVERNGFHKSYVDKGESYFATCEHDDKGHCLPKGGGDNSSNTSSQSVVSAIVKLDTDGMNFIHLGDLRESLGLEKEDFQKLIQQAQKEGLIFLSDAEGRNKLSPRDKDSLIWDGDSALLYASLRKSLNGFVQKESYFATCERDPHTGGCLPKNGGASIGGESHTTTAHAKPQESFHQILRNEDGTYTGAPKDVLERAKTLKLPPAWTNVMVSPDPKSSLQALGTDKKGREQRLYSADHSAKASAEKFLRVKSLVSQLPQIDSKIKETLQGGNGPEKEAAACLLLIRKTGFRIGSDTDTKAEKKAEGASTLQGRHVKLLNDGSLSFNFTGKKGVSIKQRIKDPELIDVMADRIKGPKDRLFKTNPGVIRDFMHGIAGSEFKVKDLRTVVAAETALDAIAKTKAPDNEAAFKKAVKAVAKQVSDKLGNTPTVALKSYIPSEVFDQWGYSMDLMKPKPRIPKKRYGKGLVRKADCKQGERSDLTGCTPQEGSMGGSRRSDIGTSAKKKISRQEMYVTNLKMRDALSDEAVISVVSGKELKGAVVEKIDTMYDRDSKSYGFKTIVSHPLLEGAEYTFAVDDEGNKFIHNDYIVVKNQGTGLGTRMFSSQVDQAIKDGYSYITLWAARDEDDEGNTTMNGYYTWPRFGFNQNIDTLPQDLIDVIHVKYPNAKDILDVMELPGGREWWKEEGRGLTNAKFDLTEGSKSRRVFDAYLKARAYKENKV